MSDLDSCLKQIEEIKGQFQADSASSKAQLSIKVVEDLRIKYLGKKGLVTGLMESLKSLSKEVKPQAGKVINELRQAVEAGLGSLKEEAESSALDASLSGYKLDVSLPTQSLQGSLHPVTLMRRVMLTEFRKLGFMRLRYHAHSDVPPDRRLCHRQGYLHGGYEGHRRSFPQIHLRSGFVDSSAPKLFPLRGTRRGIRPSVREVSGQRLPHLQGNRLARNRGSRHDSPERLRKTRCGQ
ncbi:MAG: hypothetical protein EOP07_16285 [Proteobacteria bacterium]|nr:MAG: hypothetical protein EOP07_16285 [Pseudomonadota bacterium]